MPFLPFLIFGGVVAVAATLVVKGSSNKTLTEKTIRNGVEYGPQCGTLRIVDPITYMKWVEPKLKQLGEASFNPDMPAKEGFKKIVKTIFPGPGCSWATDGSFNCRFLMHDGQVDTEWLTLINKVEGMSFGQAVSEGILLSVDGMQSSTTGRPGAWLVQVISSFA